MLCIIPLTLASPAHAFDVEGYKTGMTKSAVMSTSGAIYKIAPLEGTVDTLMATSVSDPSRYLTLNFCQDRLVSIQQGFSPNMKQASLLVGDLSKKYGDPFSVKAGTRPDPSGEIYEMGFWWRMGNEFASIYFLGSTIGDSLSVSHQATNACFKVPR